MLSLTFMETILCLRAIFTKRVICVFEGPPFCLKGKEDAKRKSAREKAMREKKFESAISVPDCLVRPFIALLVDEGVLCVISPGEADGQLGGAVDFIIIPSNDSDLLAYPLCDNIIYSPAIRTIRGHPTLHGYLARRASIFADRAIQQHAPLRPIHVKLGGLNDLLLLVLCNLLCSDYCDIPHCGLVTALRCDVFICVCMRMCVCMYVCILCIGVCVWEG